MRRNQPLQPVDSEPFDLFVSFFAFINLLYIYILVFSRNILIRAQSISIYGNDMIKICGKLELPITSYKVIHTFPTILNLNTIQKTRWLPQRKRL